MRDFIYERILYHSRVNPFATAVSDGREVTYLRFRRDIDAVAARLAHGLVAKGERVLVDVLAPYLHWVVLIACARIGAVTASIVADPFQVKLLKPQVCIKDREYRQLDEGTRSVTAQSDWLGADDGSPAAPFLDVEVDEDDPARIILSSGTTGRPKMVLITHGELRERLLHMVSSYDLSSATRSLVGVGVPTLAGFQYPCATWYAGGAAIVSFGSDLVRTWRRGRPTFMLVSPSSLQAMLQSMPKRQRTETNLHLAVAGAVLPDALNIEARVRITPSLWNVYGSTEASTISMCHASDCLRRPGFVGYAPPYVDVEVVDEHDVPLPAGQEGTLRVRGPGMALSYLDDVDASSNAFRDGWFYPGDAARIDAEGGLTITGRVNELVNIGGVKMAPERIEEALAAVPGLRELAAFAVPTPQGAQLCLAVVGEATFSEDTLMARYHQAFPSLPPPRVIRLDQLPRGEMGKVQRAQLVERAAARSAP